MAANWIPLFVETLRKPEIVTLASRLSVTRFDALGRACAIWCYASEHSVDGILHGVSLESLGEVTAVGRDFCQVLVDVGWLSVVDDGLQLPNAEWVMVGGKARLQAAKRQGKYRAFRNAKSNADVTHDRYEKRHQSKRKRKSNSKSSKPPNPLRGKSASRTDSRKKPKRESLTAETVPLPEGWDREATKPTIERWLAYRTENGFRAWRASTWLAAMGKLDLGRFTAAVANSIEHGWQGLFEPGANGTAKKSRVLNGPGQTFQGKSYVAF